jgi:hypothetical protein
MNTTRVLLGGARQDFVVKGSLDDVGRKLSDAARAHEQFAWFEEEDTDARVGINPAHVTAVTAADR